MTTKQAINEIQKNFDINAIFAHRVYLLADKTNLLEDAARIIAEKPKPFVKWVGGKRQLLAQFRRLNLYPPERFDITTGRYFEPFVGGGAVFFDLLPEAGYLSDLNKKYVSERKNLNLKKKMLAVDSTYIREHVKDMDKNTTEVRIIPKSEAFGTVMQIYDDKISYVTVSDNKKIGVIIEDPDISKMHRIIFQALWGKAEILQVGI